MRAIAVLVSLCLLPAALAATAPTFHKDVEPILQRKCQGCHRPGEAAPMGFLTYAQARPWAKAIRGAVLEKKMPPWFADPAYGHYSNDSRLSAKETQTLVAWADSGAPEGALKDAPPAREFETGWAIGKPDVVFQMPKAFQAPASGDIPYQYILMPTNLTEDRWVEAAEIRPGNRAIVHHVIVFALDPKKNALARGKLNEFLDAERIARATARKPGAPEPKQFSSGTDSETLGFFVPGYLPKPFPDNQAKLVKAGSVLLFQLHYTTAGKPQTDATTIGVRFSKHPPAERVKTVNVQNFAFSIPPNVDNYPIEARARLTRDVTLLSLLPHMHLRGKTFEYRATYPSGESETLLRIPRWDFSWQLAYILTKPKLLPKGTIIEVLATYDNTRNNKFNPNPDAEVLYGEQTWNEMMGGLMDVAIDPSVGDPELFEPVAKPSAPVSGSKR
ncbi:MAG: thiol-disulfide isomerase [Bryobacteraceae bacterium]